MVSKDPVIVEGDSLKNSRTPNKDEWFGRVRQSSLDFISPLVRKLRENYSL